MSADIAWAAGLFEGEGSITFNDQPRSMPKLALMTTDRDVVERFLDVVGCGAIHPSSVKRNRLAGYKPAWSWTVHGLPAWAVYQQLRPYLGERRQARGDEVFSSLSMLGPGGRRMIDQGEVGGKKRCVGCGEDKPLDEFPVRATSRDGRYGRCVSCDRERRRAAS